MRAKTLGARELRPHLIEALHDMRDTFLKASGLGAYREASAADDDASAGILHELAQLLEAAGYINGEKLAAALLKAMREQYGLGAGAAAEEIEFTISGADFEVPMDRALRAMDQYTMKFAARVAERQKDALKSILRAGIEAGTPTRDLADQVADMFDYVHIITKTDAGLTKRTYAADTWADMVARTEIARANNAGAIDLYRKGGFERVMFLASDDERTCPECEDLDGEIAPIGGEFSDGTAVGDPVHPDCRCTTVATDEGGDDGDPAEH